MHKLLPAVLLIFCSLVNAETYDLAIRNVTVIDAKSEPRAGYSVFVSGGEIKLVSPNNEAVEAAKNIDGSGQYLLPGFWDMHVHIVYEPALIESMPQMFLDYGITSVRDTGALLDRIAPQVKRWRALGNQAPDLYFSGPLLDGRLVVYDGDDRPEIGVSNPSVEQALRNFKALQEAGVDFIKIYELVSPEVFSALASAAEEASLPIAAHVPLSMKADTAGPKVGSMEHLRNIEITCSEQASSLFESRSREIQSPGEKSGYELRSFLHQSQREVALQSVNARSARCQQVLASLKNTIQVPTLRLNTITNYSPLNREDWQEHLDNMPPELAAQWLANAKFYAGRKSELGSQMSDWSLSLVNAMRDSGVPIGAGTDTPIGQAIPGYSLHTELERLVDAGLSNREALAAATIRPAQFFSIEDEKGLIAEGMEADLVLLRHNPLEDIRHSRSVVHVIANGEIVR